MKRPAHRHSGEQAVRGSGRYPILRVAGCCLLALGSGSVAPVRAAPQPAPEPRSVSASRQFVVEARDASLRAALCNYAEETRARVLEFLGRPGAWRYPIGIVVREAGPGSEGAEREKFTQTPGPAGPLLRIDLLLTANFQAARLREVIVHALLIELAHNSLGTVPLPAPGTIDLPAWILEGAIAATDPLADEADMDRILAQQMARGGLMSLRDFLGSDPGRLDATSRALYRAYAAAFLRLLLDLPGGRAAMGPYLRALALGRGGPPLPGLLVAFPALGGDEESAQRWWALNIARTSSRSQWQILSVAESDEELKRLLTLEFRAGNGAPALTRQPTESGDFLRHPDRKRALITAVANLGLLGARAHPLFTPVLRKYQEALTLLAKGSTDGVAKRLDEAARMLAGIKGRWKEVEDYLNWIEATQVNTQSGGFEHYLETSRALSWPKPPPRSDAISRYLDAVERETR